MSDGFMVDIGALVKAAEGVNGAIVDLGDNKVSSIGGSAADYGNAALAGTVADFCSRWQVGVQNLTNDASQVASRLALSAVAYARAEEKNVALATGVLQRRSGGDPAAAQW
jgi:thiamine biosynthesis lipoprotein ApbE